MYKHRYPIVVSTALTVCSRSILTSIYTYYFLLSPRRSVRSCAACTISSYLLPHQLRLRTLHLLPSPRYLGCSRCRAVCLSTPSAFLSPHHILISRHLPAGSMEYVTHTRRSMSSITNSHIYSVQYSQRVATVHRRPGRRLIDARKCVPGVGSDHSEPLKMSLCIYYNLFICAALLRLPLRIQALYCTTLSPCTLTSSAPGASAFARGDSAP